jgi:hypothetical protein
MAVIKRATVSELVCMCLWQLTVICLDVRILPDTRKPAGSLRHVKDNGRSVCQLFLLKSIWKLDHSDYCQEQGWPTMPFETVHSYCLKMSFQLHIFLIMFFFKGFRTKLLWHVSRQSDLVAFTWSAWGKVNAAESRISYAIYTSACQSLCPWGFLTKLLRVFLISAVPAVDTTPTNPVVLAAGRSGTFGFCSLRLRNVTVMTFLVWLHDVCRVPLVTAGTDQLAVSEWREQVPC